MHDLFKLYCKLFEPICTYLPTFYIVDVCLGTTVDFLNDPTEGATQFISSPGWPGLYPKHKTCKWTVNIRQGFGVIILLVEMALNKDRDYLIIGTFQSALRANNRQIFFV